MDNKRIILWGVVAVLIWLNVLTWQHDYPAAPEPATVSPSTPMLSDAVPPPTASSSASASSVTPADVTEPNKVGGSKIHIVTDVLDVDLNTRGGDLERADLLRYARSKEEPNAPVELLSDRADDFFAIHSGLSAADPSAAPSHQALFSSDANSYQLAQDKNELIVDLKWTDGKGVNVTKSYIFHRGSYAVEVRYSVVNNSSTAWQAASYVELYRHDPPVKRSMFNAETFSYRGPVVFDGSKNHKLDRSNDEAKNYKSTITSGWMAALQHHFVVAAIPVDDRPYEYSLANDANNNFALVYRGPLLTVEPNNTLTTTEKLFVGPKLQSQLVATRAGLETTTDYGKLTIIAQPLFRLLQFVHQAIGNWGVDIILVTLLIKLAFYWLTASSGRSMAKMRTLAPKLKGIQERYKDDREQLGRATMELYRKEKVNPVAGCLPMLIQMPFFMGFYWVLLESAEMHQAPFVGWITDLSARDPYFILPIIMGVANFVQFKVNPPQADPTQAKIMAFMPIVMTVMMAWFPAGLLLYWITNTIVSALQQWRINKLVAMDSQARKS